MRPEVLVDVVNKEAERALADEELASFVDDKLRGGELIERADDIRRDYEAATGINVKLQWIRLVMR